MNVTSTITKRYENTRLRGREKNKPNQTQPVVSLPALSVAEGVEPISIPPHLGLLQLFTVGLLCPENYVL